MQFHVTIKVLDTIVMDEDKRLRQVVGPRLQKILASGKVRASGIFASNRGGFFLMEVDSLEELYDLLGPEIYANFKLDVQPILSIEKLGQLFQKWAGEGR